MSAPIAIRAMLTSMILCPLVAHASSVPHEPGHTLCGKTSCAESNQRDGNAGYIFGKPENERETGGKPRHDRDKAAGRETDKNYGPIEIPPRGKPDLIHTGAGKNFIPAPDGIGPVVPAPAAVPTPAAAWLLVSGLAGLALSAGRRRHT